MYAISLDQHRDSWLKAIDEDGLTWTNVSELKGGENEASYVYGINGIPDNFLIDENGTIIARNLRGEDFTRKLEELFGKK
ncbi:peroxiredoxin family protein [Antarcticibacterium sp. 1MA-6-2]|uniref:peroxiredoxin family protein n=1 Tax=Antarcticibacterium sp. 1MA-6-2 TaxID=2908210 RepID=UPI0038FC04ED